MSADTSHSDSNAIRVLSVDACPVCGSTHAQSFLAPLRDRLFRIDGRWQLHRCSRSDCRHVWLSPRACDADLHKLYQNYHTHAPLNLDKGLLARLTQLLQHSLWHARYGYTQLSHSGWSRVLYPLARMLDSRLSRAILWLPAVPRGKLLDFGCGSGTFLACMAELGWQASGVDFDPDAVRVVREFHQLPAYTLGQDDAGLWTQSFDAVTMVHVLEHLAEPLPLLQRLLAALNEGGRLILVTPNLDSLVRRLLGQDWRGLEVPRHLQLYCQASLHRLAIQAIQGMDAEVRVFSTANSAAGMWRRSLQIRRARLTECDDAETLKPGWARHFGRLVDLAESLSTWLIPSGEELVLEIRKHSAQKA